MAVICSFPTGNTIDVQLNKDSNNPISNKAVAEALENMKNDVILNEHKDDIISTLERII